MQAHVVKITSQILAILCFSAQNFYKEFLGRYIPKVHVHPRVIQHLVEKCTGKAWKQWPNKIGLIMKWTKKHFLKNKWQNKKKTAQYTSSFKR